jgi:hypothetical protein
MPLSSYPNLVLALHAYTHVYTIDALMHQKAAAASYPWGGYEQSYSLAEREAAAMGAALFISEFGNSPGDDDLLLKSQLQEQERHRVGFAFWPWKENSGGSWGVFAPPTSPSEQSGCLRASRERYLARVYPLVTADQGFTYEYDAADGRFSMTARGQDGDPSTAVYVPREVTGQITSDGAVQVAVTAQPDASRMVLASPRGGSFKLAVAPAPLQLSGC